MNEQQQTTDPNYTTDSAVYFYTARFYVLDNFSAFSVEIWDKLFPTIEHAYQWKKYEKCSPEIAESIFAAQNPHAAKKISDANKDAFAVSWHEVKVQHMEEILRKKLSQHQKVHDILVETGERTIYENSPTDYFWGTGADGTGENHMGKLWMKLRDELTRT